MKTQVLLFALLAFLLSDTQSLFAQSTTDTSFCEYKETRSPVLINPKTNKPYIPEERNQEPFDGGSISKDEIRQCLRLEIMVRNHHIVFEYYRDAWKELAKETKNYAISLLIMGGVLHANTPFNRQDNTGGICLGEFQDPIVQNTSNLTEEERMIYGIKKKNGLIAFIHSDIQWIGVLIDSEVITCNKDIYRSIFSKRVNFSDSTFNKANFKGSTFSERVYFSISIFNEANFSDSTFRKANLSGGKFQDRVYFHHIKIKEVLIFDNTSWGGQVDLGGVCITKLRWDSTQKPSDVKGFVDFREAWMASIIGSATFGHPRQLPYVFTWGRIR